MKKIFTLALALIGLAGVASAATIDDVAVCKHSYVLKFEDHMINGKKPGKGSLFGDGFFLDVTGGTVGTKGAIDLSDPAFADGAYYQYAEYGKPTNTWRLKNGQDVIAMKVTAKSKIIILGESHASRGPKITDTAPASNAMQGTVLATSTDTKSTGGVFEWVADDDRTIYIGSDGGDYYVSYLIVQANEAPGTPTLKVSDMMYDGSYYYKEVSCKANPATEEGSTEQIPTLVTYTTDGATPTASSPIYKEPIRCTKDMTIKFQAFLDIDGGKANADFICDGADNEAIVNFLFDAPTITADGANVTIASKYNNATNYYSYLDVNDVAGDNFTLTESATVTAYTKIANGDVTFTSKSTSKDVYVLNPIKEKKTIKVIGGDVEIDEEATATSTTGEVYKIVNGEISADKKDFFVKNVEFSVIVLPEYQIDGETRYIKMNNTNITFQVAEGDSVNVKVICSKNSCKNLEADDNADDPTALVNDRKCIINVSGTNYFHKDAEGNEASDMKLCEDANIIEFGLAAGTYTFQKYSGTGNILVYSIDITPAASESGIHDMVAEKTVNGTIHNLAGQKVAANYKGIVIVNGKKMLNK